MKTMPKVLIVLLLGVAVAGTLMLKARQPEVGADAEAVKVEAPEPNQPKPQAPPRIPKLVDLGADKCIPCKAMAPILEALKHEYAGKMDVQFIDVWKNPDAGTEYGVELIPTQIFYDAAGKELFRHTGFFGREDILGKWKELGIELGAAPE